MARQRAGARKNHRPGYIGWTAPKFRLDEIGDATEEQTDWNGGATDIGNGSDSDLIALPEQKERDRRPGEAAVKRHAAFPDRGDFQRMRQIKAEIIEEHIADPAAEDHPKRRIDEKIIDGE